MCSPHSPTGLGHSRRGHGTAPSADHSVVIPERRGPVPSALPWAEHQPRSRTASRRIGSPPPPPPRSSQGWDSLHLRPAYLPPPLSWIALTTSVNAHPPGPQTSAKTSTSS